MKKRYLIAGVFALVVLVAVLAVACGGESAVTTTSETLPPATGEPIKIGHICDLTGVEATTGQNMKKSLELAFEAVGNRIGDRPVEIITEDAADSAATAQERAKKLVEQDGVVAIFGPTEITEKLAVAYWMKLRGDAAIPLIVYSPSPTNLTEGNPFVMTTGGSSLQQPTCMADYVYNTMGYKNVDTLGQEGKGGETFIGPFAEEFVTLGGTIVDQKWPPMNSQDFSPFLTTLKDADALVYWMPGADAIKLAIAFQQLGVDIPKVGGFHGATFDPWVLKAVFASDPEAAAGLADVPVPMEYGPDYDSAANKTFVELWNSKYPASKGEVALDGSNSNPYDAALLFIKAVEKTGGVTTPTELMAALVSTPWEGPQGPAFIDNSGTIKNMATRNVYIVKVTKSADGDEWPYHYEIAKTYEAVPPSGFVAGAAAATTTTAGM